MIEHDQDYKLAKSIWTTEDFATMGWHDSKIHGIAFDPENYKIIFDIDYIYAWAKPAPDTKYFSFWVSPCTLVFDNVYDLKIDIDATDGLVIFTITRGDERTSRNAEFINKTQEWNWIIECHEGEISFNSIGYTQYTRKQPQHIENQYFSLNERQGVKFDTVTD